MNIIVLQDRKGFTKMIEVAAFPPQYVIEEPAQAEAMTIGGGKPMVTPHNAVSKKTLFIPIDLPKVDPNISNIEVMVYKEQLY